MVLLMLLPSNTSSFHVKMGICKESLTQELLTSKKEQSFLEAPNLLVLNQVSIVDYGMVK